MPSIRSRSTFFRRYRRPSSWLYGHRRIRRLDDSSFMFEVGIDQPALVIGHSFGGGVAIKLAWNQPKLIRYLVLLNAVGGANSRPPWEWAAGLCREFWPVSYAFEMLQAMRADLVANFLHNPVGLAHAGLLAQSVDLRTEPGRAEGTRCSGSCSDQ